MIKQNAFRRGFTLIELMIVIVILGILMGTILPRLTGAQSRARDTARKADLNNIALALEVYASDFGGYPEASALGCLAPKADAAAADAAYEELGEYMKGGAVPAAVSSKQSTLSCIGSYFYMPLKQGGIDNASYVLASDVETWQLANYMMSDDESFDLTAGSFDGKTDSALIVANVGEEKVTAEHATDTTKTIYVVLP